MRLNERWYWCTGCGKWHDRTKHRDIHFLMYCSQAEPNEKNFEGTKDEIRQFQIACELAAQDDTAFNERVLKRAMIEALPPR